MPVTATISNDEGAPRVVRVALFPSPSEENGEMVEETRELAPGTTTELSLPDDRAVRLMLIPTEG